MTGVDVALAIVVLLSAVIGLVRGFMKEVLSVITWVAALILALGLAPTLGPVYVTMVESEVARTVIAFVVIFLAVLMVGALVRWALGKLVDTTGLGGTDRILGLLFGALRGAVIVIAVLIATRPFLEDAAWWRQSVLIPELMAFEQDVLALLTRVSQAVPDLEAAAESQ